MEGPCSVRSIDSSRVNRDGGAGVGSSHAMMMVIIPCHDDGDHSLRAAILIVTYIQVPVEA
eukprot:2251772-Pleurochrysis_carterae.AAC.4